MRKNMKESIVEKIKKEYLKNDIVMSELLLSYPGLSDDEIQKLLEWSGDDEFVNAKNIKK